jgi:uncharacterized LabA/DUF88 family protein
MEEKVAVFIDGSNFYHLLKENGLTTNIDFGKITKLLLKQRRLMRIYYYNVSVRGEGGIERYKSQQKFFQNLKKTPYLELKLGRLERRGDTVVEKGVDVMMVTDMLYFATTNQYDTAIVVSGDGDFGYCIKKVKELGKHVEVACPKVGFAFQLKDCADVFTVIDEKMVSECLPTPQGEQEVKQSTSQVRRKD